MAGQALNLSGGVGCGFAEVSAVGGELKELRRHGGGCNAELRRRDKILGHPFSANPDADVGEFDGAMPALAGVVVARKTDQSACEFAVKFRGGNRSRGRSGLQGCR